MHIFSGKGTTNHNFLSLFLLSILQYKQVPQYSFVKRMTNRIKVMKLILVVHLKKLDESSLAWQVLDEQIRHDWPGLAKEAKEIFQKWKMQDFTKEEHEDEVK